MSAMSSLKGYIPGLASDLGLSPAALYERQRALVRAGIIDGGEGRGPGSGVRATAPALASLLLSVLVTDNLSESEQRTEEIAAAVPIKRRQCPLTGASKLVDAVAQILTSTGLARKVVELHVSRTAQRAYIEYNDGRTPMVSEFVGSLIDEPHVRKSASVGRELLVRIASDVQAMILESDRSAGGVK